MPPKMSIHLGEKMLRRRPLQALPSPPTTRLLEPCSVPAPLRGQGQSMWSSGAACRDRVHGHGQGDGRPQWKHAPRRRGDPMAGALRHEPAMEYYHVAGARAVLHPERQVKIVLGHLWRWQTKWCEAHPMDTPRKWKPALQIFEDAHWKPLDHRSSLGKGAGCSRW